MKNIKVFLTFLLVFEYHYAASMFVNVPKQLPGAIRDFGENLPKTAEIVVDGMQQSSRILTGGGNQIADKVVEASSTIGEGLEMLGFAMVCIHIATKTVEVGKDVATYLNPSEEQQNKELHAQEKKEALKSKRELRSCLVKNHSGPRNESGRPTACEDAARTLIMMKGENALEKMTKRFTAAHGK